MALAAAREGMLALKPAVCRQATIIERVAVPSLHDVRAGVVTHAQASIAGSDLFGIVKLLWDLEVAAPEEAWTVLVGELYVTPTPGMASVAVRLSALEDVVDDAEAPELDGHGLDAVWLYAP